jgi:hypothetical protein
MGFKGVDCIQVVHYKIHWRAVCEHGNEPSDCTKNRKCPDQMSVYQFLKKNSAQ